MSGRRRVKTITYDEDDYWDGDSDYFEEEDDDEEENEEEAGCPSVTHKHSSGTGGQTTTKRGARGRAAAPHGDVSAKRSSRGQQRQCVTKPPKRAVDSSSAPSSTPSSSSSAAAGKPVASPPIATQFPSSTVLRRSSPAASCSQGEANYTRGGAFSSSRDTEGSGKREAVHDDAASATSEQRTQPSQKYPFRRSTSSATAGRGEASSPYIPMLSVVGGGGSPLPTSASLSSASLGIRPSHAREAAGLKREADDPDSLPFGGRTAKDELENSAKDTLTQQALAAAPSAARASEETPSAGHGKGVQGDKTPYAIVVIGHVDAGKSTLTGQLLFRTGAVKEREVEKMKRMSASAGKGSFFFAWLCDEGEDERQRGVTIDVSCRVIVTGKEHRRISFLDAPGHRELVSNMLGGAVLADAALLVVDAVKFDAGFGGQTKEHLLIARSLNIQHFVVAVNKLDAVDWSEKAYNDIVERLQAFLTGPEIACPVNQIYFVPVSAIVGVNVASEETCERLQSRKCSGGRQTSSTDGQKKRESVWNTEQLEAQTKLLRSWWTGPSLLDLLENIQINTLATQRQLTNEPFSACVADIWSLSSTLEELNLSFKVASGALSVGDKVGALPANVVLVCKALSSYGVATNSCASGDFVEKGIFSYAHSAPAIDKCTPSAGIEAVGVGTVLCSSMGLLRVVSTFLCKVVVFSRELPLMPGRQLVAYIHTMTCQCSVRRVLATLDKKTGEVVKHQQARRCALVFGMAGIVEVDISPGKVCVREKREPHEQTSVLSRIILRDPTGTAAAGVVVGNVGV